MQWLPDELLTEIWVDAFFADPKCMPVNKKIRSLCWLQFFKNDYPSWCVTQIKGSPSSVEEFDRRCGLQSLAPFVSHMARRNYVEQNSFLSLKRTAKLAMIVIVAGNHAPLAFEIIYRTCYNLVTHTLPNGAHTLHKIVLKHLDMNYQFNYQYRNSSVDYAASIADLLRDVALALDRVCASKNLSSISEHVLIYKGIMNHVPKRAPWVDMPHRG